MSIPTVLFTRIGEWISSALKLYGALGLSLIGHAALIGGSTFYYSNPIRQFNTTKSDELIVNLVSLRPSHPSISSSSSSLMHASSATIPHGESPPQAKTAHIMTKPSIKRKHEETKSIDQAILLTDSLAQRNLVKVVITPAPVSMDEGTDRPATNVAIIQSSELSSTSKYVSENTALHHSPMALVTDPIILLDAPNPHFAPAPDYPDEARWEEREGRTALRFRLHPDGSVAETQVVDSSGHADLDAAALATLRQWRFKPAGDISPSSESWYRYAFRFALR